MRTRVAALWREHRTMVNRMVLFLHGSYQSQHEDFLTGS